jgi:hypothetical protein
LKVKVKRAAEAFICYNEKIRETERSMKERAEREGEGERGKKKFMLNYFVHMPRLRIAVGR